MSKKLVIPKNPCKLRIRAEVEEKAELTAPSVCNVKVSFLRERGFQNFEEWRAQKNSLYVGRNMSFYVKGADKSKWANPFSVKKYGSEECLEKYEGHVREGELYGQLLELTGRELGCWCHPEPCHGGILVKLFNEKFRRA